MFANYVFIIFLLPSLCLSCPVCPVFTSPSYKASIPENATIGTQVLTVIAFNAFGDPMIYGIIYIGKDFPFEIEPTTGVIKVSNPLDYDINSEYEFTVQASISGFYTSVPTLIQVSDVPDPLQPVSCYPKTHLLVLEESKNIGNTSQWLNCSLPNKPDDKLLYVVQDGPISVDSSGFIILIEKLDYENQTQFNITVTFTDSENNSIDGVTFLIIQVLPINEHAPVFIEDEYIFTIQESVDIGYLVGTVVAYDNDLSFDGIITYQITSGNGSEMFALVSNTGKLYTSSQFDFEENQLFQLIITAFDAPVNSSLTLTNVTIAYIYINDTNDNIPKFNKDIYFAKISEDSIPQVSVLYVECTDLDSGLNAIISYAMINTSNGLFSINDSTGLITLEESVDFETLSLHQFWVMCLDHGMPSLSSEVLVIVQVSGANEYDPYFNNKIMNFSVAENSAIGSIIGQLEANDEDTSKAGEITFELIHSLSCPSIVDVTIDTGILVVIGDLDYESFLEPVLYCSVRVWDNQDTQRMSEGMVKITIDNVNDCPPRCDPGIRVVTVSESLPIGSEILILNCTDPDLNDLDYAIINNTQDEFEIQSKPHGTVLTLASKLDYETATSHISHISVSDGMYSTLLVIYLIVVPVNEYNPVFTNNVYNCSISEASPAGDCVCTVLAEDLDKSKDGDLYYYLMDEDMFVIDEQTGKLYLTQTLDYEDTQLYQFTIYASDLSLTDQLSGSAIINIHVEDSNDNAPYISQYTFSEITENAAIGTVLSIINCTDIDSGQNGYTTLEITSVTAYNQDGTITEIINYPFVIDNETRTLSVSGDIDFESTGFYKLLIECTDAGIYQLKSTGTIMITINDINEYSPKFPYKLLDMTLNTQDKVETILFPFTASDNDIADSITYSMSIKHPMNVPETSQFLSIELLSGILLITSPVKCSYGSKYIYIVTATDSGEPYSLNDTLEAHFNIEDCGDSPPIAKSNTYTASVLEDCDNGSVVVKVNCSTAEYVSLPDGVDIYYNITDNLANQLFSIGLVSGEIVTSNGLDYEEQSLHIIHVSCYYSHTPHQTRDMTVYIQVLPVNEYTPVFSDNQIWNITEAIAPGTKIARVTAVDNDDDEDGNVHYFISNSSEFSIDPLSGDVYLLKYLDRETKDSYKVTVLAYDNPLNISNRRTGSIVLDIVITDFNDNFPYCNPLVQYINLPVTTAVGTVIANINCSDIDQNNTLQYYISNVTTIWLVDVESSTGIVYLSSVINATLPLYYTIPISVSDEGVPPLITTMYLSISLDLTGDVLIQDEMNAIEKEREGWMNNVTLAIDNMNLEKWTDATEEILKTAIADMTSTYCALQPLSCSLLTSCTNNTLKNTRSINCDEYTRFSSVGVVIHHSLAEETKEDVTKLYIYIYVTLPEGVVRSPFRDTEYVIPRDTLNVIVTNHRDSIGALIRDAVYDVTQVAPLNEAWKELAISLLVIMLSITSVVLIVVIATRIYKHYILKRKNAVIPFEFRKKTTPTLHDKMLKVIPTLQIQKLTTSLSCTSTSMNCSVIPTSTSSPHHSTHDGCSLMNVSEDSSTECNSSTVTNGHESSSSIHANETSNWTNRNSIIKRLTSKERENTNHPLAAEGSEQWT